MSAVKGLEEKVSRGDYQFPIGVYQAIFGPGEDGYAHWHKEMEISYIRKGTGDSVVDQIKDRISTGDIVLVQKDLVHFMNCNENDLMDVATIVFDLDLLANPSYDYCQNNYIVPLQNKIFNVKTIARPADPGYDEIRRVIERIIVINELEEKPLGIELEVKSLLYSLLSTLFYYGYIIKTEEKSPKSVQKQNAIKNVLNFIFENYNKELKTAKLASIAGYSEFHFIRFFKEQTGKTCKEFVNTIRLEKAINLLNDSSLSISEIANEVGYNDLSYFIKVFKNRYQIPPHKYRRQK